MPPYQRALAEDREQDPAHGAGEISRIGKSSHEVSLPPVIPFLWSGRTGCRGGERTSKPGRAETMFEKYQPGNYYHKKISPPVDTAGLK